MKVGKGVEKVKFYEYVLTTQFNDNGDITREIRYCLSETGLSETQYSRSKSKYHLKKSESIAACENFSVDSVLSEKDDKIDTCYDITLNGTCYFNKTVKEIVGIFKNKVAVSNKVFNILGTMMAGYARKYNVPVIPYSEVCGFAENGWNMPPENHFNFVGLLKKIEPKMREMCDMKVTKSKAVEYMKTVYEAINVKYKDIILAGSMFLPFAYALKKITDLSPWIMLQGSHTAGKTTFAELITKKFWNTGNVVNPDTLNSSARLGQLMSILTLPVVVDECGKLEDKVLSILKTLHTSDTQFLRLNRDGSVGIDQLLTRPPIYTCNNIPEIFHETPMLSRGVIIPIDVKLTAKNKQIFKTMQNVVPDGYIGRYIMEFTKSWNADKLTVLYNKTKTNGDVGARVSTIRKLFGFGKLLMKEAFGIDLEISELAGLINRTLKIETEDLPYLIFLHIHEILKLRGSQGDFRAKGWIRSDIEELKHDKVEGVIYNKHNLADFNTHLKTRYNLKDIKQILDNAGWDGIERGNIRNNKYGMFIPITTLNEKIGEL